MNTSAPPNARTNAASPDLLAVLGLIAACIAGYAQTLGFGFINFDDPGYVIDNPAVRGGLSWANFRWAWTATEQSNWHPLTWLSLMADAQWCGLNAGGYHLTSFLVHAANSALLFAWLRRATGAFWPCVVVAAFFAVHPLHVESVAWISERKDVLSAFFCFATLLAYTRFARGGGAGHYALSIVLFALGLMAKPMLVTLPLLLLLIDCWPLQRGAPRLWEKAPFFALSAASCAITLVAQRAGHAVVPFRALSISERFGAAIAAGAGYLGKTFWPVNLGIYYPYVSQRPVWQTALCAGLLLTLTAIAWGLRRSAPYVAVGWAWFLISLAPVIGIVQVGGQSMADRYTYLPHVGLFMALAWGGAGVLARWPSSRWGLIAAATVGAAACLALTARQASFWQDGATLFAHTFRVSRTSVNLCTLYGDACLGAGRFAEAEFAYRQGLRLRPANADLLGKLGYAQMRQGHWEPALASVSEADRLAPGEARILCDQARILDRLGRQEEALEVYRRCLQTHPDSAAAQLGLADTLLGLGKPAEATAAYEAALALQPDSTPTLNHLAWLLAVGQFAEPTRALALARRAVSLTHGRDMDSLDALAAASAANGRWDLAVSAADSAQEAAREAGAPPAVIAIRVERARTYRAGKFPQR